ncbi:MAG: DUF4410 domain-containing protein [Stellaceae bacterium]|jgi:hypothetical protein
MPYSIRQSAIFAFAAAFLVLAAGCTTVTVTPQSNQPPPQIYHAAALVKVDVQDPAFAYLGPSFRKGFIRRLGELKAFDSVTETPPRPADNGVVVVSATITEVDKGDAVLRMLIGMGAGHEHIIARLDMQSADGKPVGSFQVIKDYAGGAGIGGATMVDIEDLMVQVGEQGAQSLLDWSQGKLVAAAN